MSVRKYSFVCASDVEGDTIKCRLAENSKDECGGICNPPANFFLDEDACTMSYYPSASAVGWYGIALQIEDYYPGTNIVLSSSPLQFLLNVITASCASNPVFVDPTPKDGICIPISGTYTADLVAQPQSGGSYINTIGTTSPSGMSKTSLDFYNGSSTEKYVTVTWTPSAQQSGPTVYCFYAIDSSSKTPCSC
ncbi:hypothetical protein KUTeg_020889 [Tegillarca granosa]|uniref:Uncharacterized protein n=1 Tax=Tegillarca granosa TaxID=220873 RepID=A0ABQ9EED2_TEGGR|nr:hypothetical protein KUTeg_020889 [Tegillarca granosa]